MKPTIEFSDFLKVDIRHGQIIKAQVFPQAKKPAYQLWIDFGKELGIKKTSAQITDNYTCTELIGQAVLAVVNFPPKQIASFMSEVLVLGLADESGAIVLIEPQKNVPLGTRLH